MLVDSVRVATTYPSQNRQDVCNYYGNRPGCPYVGWSYQLDTTQWADGAHTVTFQTDATAFSCSSVNATSNNCDNSEVAPLSVSVPVMVSNLNASNPIKLFVDSPNAGSGNLSGTVTVSGWALSTSSLINAVALSVDGVHVGSATYGTSRPDVCVAYPTAQGCPALGWTYALDTTLLADGTHKLEVTATPVSGTGGSIQTSFTVANASATNPFHAYIDNPIVGSTVPGGTIALSGWAVNDNAAVSSVQISVDGVSQGSASYGSSVPARPDVCA